MSDKKKILYVQTSGPNAPERQYAPLILAQTARAMDLDATIFYLGMGLKVEELHFLVQKKKEE